MILLFSLILIVISGCSTENKPPSDDIIIDDSVSGINGTIKTYTEKNNVISIVVDGVEEITMKTHFYDRAHVSVTNVTKVYRGEAEVLANELKEGMNVNIVFYGPITESYPVQAKAKTITIVESE